jgi:hypothetical protein
MVARLLSASRTSRPFGKRPDHNSIILWTDFTDEWGPSIRIDPLVRSGFPSRRSSAWSIILTREGGVALDGWFDSHDDERRLDDQTDAPAMVRPRQMVPICRKRPDHNSIILWIDFTDGRGPSIGDDRPGCGIGNRFRWFRRDLRPVSFEKPSGLEMIAIV